ncbi:formate hydrogenlyase subunit 3/multisubunit Na+/H+ antiporter, MnhD subunit [Desulfosporosinus acidiphilus SJ4]|uniref:Formate hydrogenlyase subunit 3/multisubunit Na+/H+ antiporter, MnhD subunit n=1 Tax=Desulfosporosinus acidiphilus (strain DSM 22704 / JCM 16185 / SJ4) TaxID=646529 RepID=I4D0S3_DESAJ|nr:hydrogenase 4 subunit F [Desulfosporosinus acidiphilus]AFM39397.1 formate hydrogenlyase subunit 3/multisubunit Na+/H+ antiporter, MnhD subunit [Desulfosporosinus acidiphilus SJ4]
MGILLLTVPVIAALLLLIIKQSRFRHAISVGASSLLLISASSLNREVLLHGSVQYASFGSFFYVDALSMIVLDIVLIISFMAAIVSIGYLEEEIKQGKLKKERLGLYYSLMYTFIFTMVLALTVKNMGLMWIAIEATTLSSAFLVGFYNDKHALEAAWKYVILCSVGIAIALLGIILLHLSSAGVLNSSSFLDWTALYAKAPFLQSSVLRLAFIFILVGFGTKAGLAPMHNWLPDAHSQAPSPISAMLSGVLLNTALYGIIRAAVIVNHNQGGSSFTGRLLMGIGILSIATAAVFILTQKDYKRLLAYSSIEHMGIIVVAMGLYSPLSVFGGLMHMINHSLTKSMLFFSSGNIMQKYETKQISKLKGVLKIMPVTGTVFLLGLFAIAGTPPFSVFASEFSIVVALFTGPYKWVGVIFVLLLAAVFAGIAVTLLKIFYGAPSDQDLKAGELNLPGTVCLVILLVGIAISGLYMPGDIKELITRAQGIILGT